jgi:minor extracellular serine protease Vpr
VELVRDLELHTDRVPGLHKVASVWEQIGGASLAGEGIKIAILDTGIEHSHPAFSDSEMEAPEGFPQADREQNRVLTNGKVIVARSFDGFDARDRVGHGTAVAMVAAGAVHDSPAGVIAGVAPRAWIGNYRVNRDATRSIPTDFAVLAVNAAIEDGMDVINMSFGSNGLAGSAGDMLAESARNAAERGVVVVISAGNSGPDIMMVDDSSADPLVLSVGANQSDRASGIGTVSLPMGPAITETGASTNAVSGQVFTGQLFNVEQLDPTGLLCGAVPAESLTGTIPLIQRGECNFTVKLRNAFLGGAEAAILYNSATADFPDLPFTPDVDADPTIPALTVSRPDGLRIKTEAAEEEEYQVVVRFGGMPNNPFQLASFSSLGPSVDLKIKPDLVATGASVFTAAQTGFPGSSLYNAGGYTTTQGTSFSAPVVAGAAAVLMAARPGLGSAEYRSLLVNSASPLLDSEGSPITVMHSGAGSLDLDRALNATVTAFPVSVSFGAQEATVDDWKQVIIRNVTNGTVTYQLSIESQNEVVPVLTEEQITLGPDEIAGPVLMFGEGGLVPGTYEGFLRIGDVENGTVARVPYWMAVRGGEPEKITAPILPTSGRSGTAVTIYFRVHEASGVATLERVPEISVESGDGAVDSLQPSELYPNTWWLRYRLGTTPGANRFRIGAGAASRTVTITGAL